MPSPRSFTNQDVSLRTRGHIVSDVVAVVAVAVVFWLFVELSQGLAEPLDQVSAPAEVSTDPVNLPYYAALRKSPPIR